MLIDAHLHIWKADAGYPNQRATTVAPACDIPETLLRDYMDEHGVDRAVLVQPMYPGEDNNLVADTAAREPDRYAAVCVVFPMHADAPEKLEYWVRERGCRGLRLRPAIADEEPSFGSVTSMPLWEKAEELGIAVNILARPRHLPAIHALAERFASVPIIIDHLAHPDLAAGVNGPDFQSLLGLAKFPNVSLKPTGCSYYSLEWYPYADCFPLIQAAFEAFGPSRLIWGSDFPHVLLSTGYRRALLLAERFYSFFSEADRALLLGGNAARIYWGE